MSIADTLHRMTVAMCEVFQIADDSWFQAHGRSGTGWKIRNVVGRDRLKASQVWARPPA